VRQYEANYEETKPNLRLGDQIPETAPQVILNKKGEHVVTDRKLTIQYVFNVLFW